MDEFDELLGEAEEWRVIADAPNYSVSNFGRVRRETEGPGTYAGKIKGGNAKTRGYLVVMLVAGKKRRAWPIHRLVCLAFHGRAPTDKHEAAHLDGNRLNNLAANLAWKLPIENTHDKYVHGTMPYSDKHWNCRLTDAEVRAIRSSSGRNVDLANAFGMSASHICGIRRGYARETVADATF